MSSKRNVINPKVSDLPATSPYPAKKRRARSRFDVVNRFLALRPGEKIFYDHRGRWSEISDYISKRSKRDHCKYHYARVPNTVGVYEIRIFDPESAKRREEFLAQPGVVESLQISPLPEWWKEWPRIFRPNDPDVNLIYEPRKQ